MRIPTLYLSKRNKIDSRSSSKNYSKELAVQSDAVRRCWETEAVLAYARISVVGMFKRQPDTCWRHRINLRFNCNFLWQRITGTPVCNGNIIISLAYMTTEARNAMIDLVTHVVFQVQVHSGK